MDGILRNLTYAFVYLDDILVASRDPSQHKHHLRELFALLSAQGISINKKKCVFGQEQVKYLGHLVSAQGIAPLPARVQSLLEFPPPSTKLALQRFLGILNYYRRFIPRLADKLTPLHTALAGSGVKEKKKGKKEFLWTAPCEAAFREAKEALASATLLHHPSPASPTALHVDASGEAIGAELAQQDRGGSWRPVAFFSKGLTAAQRKYSAFDRELLAIYASIKHLSLIHI